MTYQENYGSQSDAAINAAMAAAREALPPVPPPPPPGQLTPVVMDLGVPELDTTAQLESLVRRYRSLTAEAAVLTAEAAELKTRAGELMALGTKIVVDGIGASHRPGNRKFSLELALKHLPLEKKADCVDKNPRFDPEKIRAAVEQAGLLELCMEDPDPTKPGIVKLA